jgi:hypothetical protein
MAAIYEWEKAGCINAGASKGKRFAIAKESEDKDGMRDRARVTEGRDAPHQFSIARDGSAHATLRNVSPT